MTSPLSSRQPGSGRRVASRSENGNRHRLRRTVTSLIGIAAGALLAVSINAPLRNIPVDAAFPGKNGLITWVDDCFSTPDTMVMNPDGTGERTLVAGGGGAEPAWSPDGTKVAYETGLGVVVWDTEAGRSQYVSGAKEPAWSSDGKRLVYVDDNERGLSLYDLAKGESRPLFTDEESYFTDPTWNPRSNQIVFSRMGGSPYHIDLWTLNAAGGGLKQLTGPPQGQSDTSFDYAPNFRPDGSDVVYQARGYGAPDNLWIVPAGGGISIQVTSYTTGEGASYPVFSPENTGVLHVYEYGDEEDPYIAEIRFEGKTLLTRRGTALEVGICDLDWAPAPAPKPALSARMMVDADVKVGLGDRFTVSLVATNTGNVALDNVMPSADLAVEGTGEVELVSGPKPVQHDNVEEDEVVRFDYVYEAAQGGTIRFKGRVKGKGPGTTSAESPVARSLLMKVAGPAVSARFTVSDLKVGLEDRFTVSLFAKNVGWTELDDVMPAGTLKLDGTGRVSLVSGPTPAEHDNVARESEVRFDYVFEATGDGLLTFKGKVKGNGPRSSKTESAEAASPRVLLGPHEVNLTFEPSRESPAGDVYEVDSDGFSRSIATVTVTTTRGKPVAGQELSLEPNVIEDPRLSGDPRMLMCDPKGRMWPGRNARGNLTYLDYPERSTDDQGRVQFLVFAGTQSGGDWLLDAREPQPSEATDAETLEIIGPVGSLPRLYDPFNEHFQARRLPTLSPAGTPAQKQDSLLEWLVELRWLALGRNPGGPQIGTAMQEAMRNTEFAPIHSSDGRRAAIVFYGRGSSPNALLNYMLGGPRPGNPNSYRVLDADNLQGIPSEGNRPRLAGIQGDLPTLAEWERARGVKALPGRLKPYPDEDLTYFGHPYPAPAGTAERGFLGACINLPGLTATIHSPVNVLFAVGSRKAFGVDAEGNLHYDLPGVYTADSNGGPASFYLPPGGYSVRLAAIGDGPAVLEVTNAAAGPDRKAVFALSVEEGEGGTLAIMKTGPAKSLIFEGRRITAKGGLELRAIGIPKSLAPRRTARVRLRVLDPFGEPVAGALVTAKRGSYAVSAFTGEDGRLVLRVQAGVPGTRVTLRVTAPGYATLRKVIPIKKPRPASR
jgi:hypothetical protein